MQRIGIIPARYHSSRFQGKVLAIITEKTVLQSVYEQAIQAGLDDLIVATDHEAVKSHVEEFGGKAVMTDPELTSGTDRCAEALKNLGLEPDVVVNIQADEPFIEPEEIQRLTEAFANAETQIATLAKHIKEPDDLYTPNVVKVACDLQGRALYFSRATIPYLRDVKLPQWVTHHPFYQHLGIYAYRGSVLKTITELDATPLEQVEGLEQLRWLEHGYPIQVLASKGTGIGIDTLQDLRKARQQVRGE
jgi:3-deoxy-manno-octulosonate cytidylyltransferase (CMP-KDO synthetase)